MDSETASLFKPYLAADEEGHYFLLAVPSINDAFMARIVHEDDADAPEIGLSGLSAGAGPWVIGQFDFFGDSDSQWVRTCAEYAAHIVEKWHHQGRLTLPKSP